MSGIPTELFRRLRDTLLNCGPFGSYDQLKAVFAHPKLKPYQHAIPQAPNPSAQVNAVIAYLDDRRLAETRESALVLLLRVLSEQVDPGAECHRRLAKLAGELERVLGNGDAEARPLSLPAESVAKIEGLVREDRLAEALAVLSDVQACRDEADLLTGRLNRIRKQERQGVIRSSSADVERTRIAKAILDIVSS